MPDVNGRWMVFTGNDSGRSEIYVRPFPNVDDGRELVSPAGGNEPTWSADGTELFYWNDATRSMMVVPVTLEPTFRAGVVTLLFEGDYLFPAAGRHYDVHPDGQRFLMTKPVTRIDPTSMGQGHVIYIQNWITELERLVPTKN